MMRKDRRGIAITKGSKRHKITFRDEVPEEVAKVRKEEAINIERKIKQSRMINPV